MVRRFLFSPQTSGKAFKLGTIVHKFLPFWRTSSFLLFCLPNLLFSILSPQIWKDFLFCHSKYMFWFIKEQSSLLGQFEHVWLRFQYQTSCCTDILSNEERWSKLVNYLGFLCMISCNRVFEPLASVKQTDESITIEYTPPDLQISVLTFDM